MTPRAPVIDLTDVELFASGGHHRALAQLREHAPVYWNDSPDGGFWALTRYDDVVAAYRDNVTFSSSRGAVLGGSFRSNGDSAAGRMLVAMDVPRHRMLRTLMHPAFATDMGVRVRRQVATLLDAALDRLTAAGGGDFAREVAVELPAGALMAMAGIGHDDALELISLTRRMIGYRESAGPESQDDERLRLALAQGEIFAFFSELVRERRARPGDDLVSILLRAELNGRPLPEEDILYNCLNVAVGGNETSSYTACAGVEVFMAEPGQWQRLLAAPELLECAVEEVLRWSSTNAYVRRAVTRDVEIGGTVLPEGSSVTLWNVSANRDAGQFPEPDRFDAGRSPNRHLSFGSGTHRCIGAPIGQIELSSVFGRMAARGLTLAPAGPAVRLRSNFILGFTALPVQIAA